MILKIGSEKMVLKISIKNIGEKMTLKNWKKA
jgi:hypothetical protein